MMSLRPLPVSSLIAACAFALFLASDYTGRAGMTAAQPGAPTPGQTATRLPDGRILLLGGEESGRFLGAMLVDPATGRTVPVPGLAQARAWHTATLLADGTVLVAGGLIAEGQVASATELFDPESGAFVQIAVGDTVPRAGHTATLLTDGRVLMTGGVGADGTARSDAELWTVDGIQAGETVTIAGLAESLSHGRAYHRATLLADGTILVEGGDPGGAPGTVDQVWPDEGRIRSVGTIPPEERPVRVAAWRPANGAVEVLEDVRVSVRFSSPIDPGSLTDGTVRLSGPEGDRALSIVVAEGGRLAFVRARQLLELDTEYVLTLAGARAQDGEVMAPSAIAFTTRTDPVRNSRIDRDNEAWIPDADAIHTGWRTNRPDSPWQALPPLTAPPGVTAVAGHVLRLDGRPLPDVTLEMEGRTARSDRTGRFLLLLADLPSGRHELLIDGRSASRPNRPYGIFEVGVDVVAGRTVVLPYTTWMPLLDTAHKVAIPSPTIAEVVVRTPLIPGLELHLAPGTVIRDHEGQIVREVSITPIPLDRPPFPLPSIQVPVYFTIQPGGAYVYASGYGGATATASKKRARHSLIAAARGGYGGAWLVYPGGPGTWPGKRTPFYHYEPDEKGWYVYGLGTVTPDGSQVVPDRRTRLYEFTGAMINAGASPPPDAAPPGDECCNDGDPVNLWTGLFEWEQTDISLPDVLPLTLTRTYRTRDLDVRPFGIGTTHQYAMFLWSALQYQEADLILPDGGRIHYVRTSPGTGYLDAVFEHVETATTSATPTAFYKSVLAWNGNGWDLTLKDGTVYVFGDEAPLQAIRDRHGNTIRFTWSTTNAFGSGTGNLLQVTSPHGRSITFAYDASNRIIEAKDNIGRTWGYTYNAAGTLWKVTDPLNQVTEYTYDTAHRMLTVKNRNGVVVVVNQYTTAADAPTPVGWVKKQTLADGGVYEFTYTVVNGKSTQTDVQNPRGFLRRVTFNSDGYTLTDTAALGTPAELERSTDRQPRSNLVTTVTRPDGQQIAMTFDQMGNLTSSTQLAGTVDAVTTTYTYEPLFHQVASVTNHLDKSRTFTYDAHGRLTTATDPLHRQTSVTYDTKGQLLTVKDALHNVWSYAYRGGDLVKSVDPLGFTRTRFVDNVGRIVSAIDEVGGTTRFTYDALDRLVSITDARGATTTYGYYPEGQLATIVDARGGLTRYEYDSLGRLVRRFDQLLRGEYWSYDQSGNLVQRIDRKGQMTSYSFDSLNRLTNVLFSDASTIAYSYDTLGRVVEIVDSESGLIGRTYDDVGRVASETTPHGTVSYTYDVIGRQTSMSASGQLPVIYSYDDDDQLVMIGQGMTTVAFEYDQAGRRTRTVLPNDISIDYAYDPKSQLLALTYSSGTSLIGDITYTYDPLGNRTQVGGSFASILLPQANGAALYNGANQLVQWGAASISYDANGNLVSDGLSSYVWNARDLLSRREAQSVIAFSYDPIGRRDTATIGAVTKTFLYDGYDIVQEQSSGVPAVSLLRGGGVDELLVRSTSSDATFPLLDALGSTVGMVDATGSLGLLYHYEPFGRTVMTGTGARSPIAYTGREADAEDLYYYRSRYYNPVMGRFISEDPIGEAGGLNLYAYVDNNPVNLRDPSGTVAVNISPLQVNVWATLDQVVAACGGRLTYWGCGGLARLRMNCECLPDGCGNYSPRIAISGELRIEALKNPKNATVEEVIREEMKHVKAAERALATVVTRAERLEDTKYRFEWTCKTGCWSFVRSATREIEREISRVHKTDPHPRR